MAKELYDRLGVSETASQKEIESAYRALSADCDASDEKRQAELREAYEVLSDLDRRANYDIRGQKTSGIRRRHGGTDTKAGTPTVIRARVLLNRIFLCGAAASAILFVCYLSGASPVPFYWVCGASLLIKISEYLLRLIQ